jgi:hypothetical protein
MVQGGGQLASTSTAQAGPKSQGGGNVPIPPWLLIVLGAGLLVGAFLGFRFLGGPDTFPLSFKGGEFSEGAESKLTPPSDRGRGTIDPPDP